ncbi:DinB family protein [Spiractinospora alimapuensis]|uniref:DinB family protein n=1 Tax=Spiractinospora alimapuensis TaxID=2820884 RepID=UPI001F2DEEAA|nr:DinB family protein [Spiractinospora alimapuensis]QVQ54192.1 DinB family protein [Spiractinospora alimapuensis]
MTTENLTHETDPERETLLETLAKHRGFLRYTVEGLTDEQAGLRPTVSELCLGGLIKHVAATEEGWMRFVLEGPESQKMPETEEEWAQRAAEFSMLDSDTLPAILERYADVAARTEEVVRGLDTLDVQHPLPEAPWNPPGARWSARRVLLHVLAETAQHAGHADILRESIDGQKTMG